MKKANKNATSNRIRLTSNLFMTMDAYNYILKEEATNEKTGKPYERVLGYYYKLEDIAKAAIKRTVQGSESYELISDLKELTDAVKKATNKIDSDLKDLNLKENISKKD